MNNILYQGAIKQPNYIEQHPYVDDTGIYIPVNEYVLEGSASIYRLLLSKEMFIEAYNKWIKGEQND